MTKAVLLASVASAEPPDAVDLWNEETFCRITGTPRRTAQRWRVTGDGPPYCRIGPRKVAYRPADVARWLESRTYRHRADELSREAGGRDTCAA